MRSVSRDGRVRTARRRNANQLATCEASCDDGDRRATPTRTAALCRATDDTFWFEVCWGSAGVFTSNKNACARMHAHACDRYIIATRSLRLYPFASWNIKRSSACLASSLARTMYNRTTCVRDRIRAYIAGSPRLHHSCAHEGRNNDFQIADCVGVLCIISNANQIEFSAFSTDVRCRQRAARRATFSPACAWVAAENLTQ